MLFIQVVYGLSNFMKILIVPQVCFVIQVKLSNVFLLLKDYLQLFEHVHYFWHETYFKFRLNYLMEMLFYYFLEFVSLFWLRSFRYEMKFLFESLNAFFFFVCGSLLSQLHKTLH